MIHVIVQERARPAFPKTSRQRAYVSTCAYVRVLQDMQWCWNPAGISLHLLSTPHDICHCFWYYIFTCIKSLWTSLWCCSFVHRLSTLSLCQLHDSDISHDRRQYGAGCTLSDVLIKTWACACVHQEPDSYINPSNSSQQFLLFLPSFYSRYKKVHCILSCLSQKKSPKNVWDQKKVQWHRPICGSFLKFSILLLKIFAVGI